MFFIAGGMLLLSVITFIYLKYRIKLRNTTTLVCILFMTLVLAGVVFYNIIGENDSLYIAKVFWSMYLLFLLTFHDLDEKLLPRRILSFAIAISIILICFEPQNRIAELILTGIVAAVLLSLTSYVSKGGIGMGDAIVFLFLGFMQGAEKTILILLVTIFITGVIGIVLFGIKKANRKMELPFVPFVLLAFVITEFL